MFRQTYVCHSVVEYRAICI